MSAETFLPIYQIDDYSFQQIKEKYFIDLKKR